MAKDFLYTKAPLIEVVAEIHWELQPLLAIPNAAVDPHFPLLSAQFADQAKAAGYTRVERLVPDQMPTEMFPHKPLFRFRRPPEEWPLFQIGPGLLAVNIIPPYQGWGAFSVGIEQALGMLFKAYPLPDKYLKIEKLELRYIDGFTKMLGFGNYMAFANEQLKLGLQLPEKLASLSGAAEDAVMAVDMRISTREPKGSVATLKVSPGAVGNEKALLMEISCQSDKTAETQNPISIMAWMNSAHESLREIFAGLTSDALKEQMGPVIEIGKGAQ